MNVFLGTVVVVTALGLFAPAAPAGEAGAEDAARPLDQFVGTWRVDAEWAGGEPLIAYASYQRVLGGAWVEAETIIALPDGRRYQRYHGLMRTDEAEPTRVHAHVFDYSGAYSDAPYALEVNNGRPLLVSEWSMGEATIRERFGPDARGNLAWTVLMRPSAGGDFTTILDDAWEPIESAAMPVLEAPGCHESIEPVAPLVGSWSIDTAWNSGGTLEATQHVRPIVTGRFLHATTIASDNGGAPYNRYRAVLGRNADGVLTDWVFQHDGTLRVLTVNEEDGALVLRENGGAVDLEQRIRFAENDDSFGWSVRAKPAGDAAAWMDMIDAEWTRQEGEFMSDHEMSARPIESRLFPGGGPDPRGIQFERVIHAPKDRVFAAWSDGPSFKAAFGPEREELVANIDLMIGGRYEWLFDGETGSNGCQVLSYLPGRMISFSWNAPPQFDEARAMRTWVVVECEPVDAESTRVRLTQLGFGEGKQWDDTREYFSTAWPTVLRIMSESLEAG
ncbi:MAG: SRPBCC domain-containing protein [Planctomycetota bacterium]